MMLNASGFTNAFTAAGAAAHSHVMISELDLVLTGITMPWWLKAYIAIRLNIFCVRQSLQRLHWLPNQDGAIKECLQPLACHL